MSSNKSSNTSSNMSLSEILISASTVGITFTLIGGLVAYDYKKYASNKPSVKFQMVLKQDKSLLGCIFINGFIGTAIGCYISPWLFPK